MRLAAFLMSVPVHNRSIIITGILAVVACGAIGSVGEAIAATASGVYLKFSGVANGTLLSSDPNIDLERGAIQTKDGKFEPPGLLRVAKREDLFGTVGRFGDWVFLKPGSFTLSLDGPSGYRLSVGCAVGTKGIAVVGVTAEDLGAWNDRNLFIENWAPSVRRLRSIDGNRYEMLLPDPIIKLDPNREKRNPPPEMTIWKHQETRGVTVSSSPQGAEILVNGLPVGKTPSRINIPCDSRDTVDAVVLVRKAGYVNCYRRITKDSGEEVACKLRRP